jgi:mannose-6-phosphate isomerase-like protein (cupin superfamily)
MRTREQDLLVEPGEFVIIPPGVEHLPSAEAEVCVMLIEPASTLNTGTESNDRTVAKLQRL